MKEEWLHLVHGEIDGMHTPEESQRLHRLMEEQPELKKLYLDMKALQDSLDGVELVEPPSNMTYRIMNAIEGSTASRPAPLVMPRWRIAFGFGLGLVTASILLFLVFDWPGNIPHLEGVMTGWDPSHRIIDSVRIQSDSVRGEFKAGRSDESIRIALALDAEVSAEISVRWEAGRMTLHRFESDRPARMSIVPGEATIRHDGSNGYAFAWTAEHGGSSVFLRIVSDTVTILERRVVVP